MSLGTQRGPVPQRSGRPLGSTHDRSLTERTDRAALCRPTTPGQPLPWSTAQLVGHCGGSDALTHEDGQHSGSAWLQRLQSGGPHRKKALVATNTQALTTSIISGRPPAESGACDPAPLIPIRLRRLSCSSSHLSEASWRSCTLVQTCLVSLSCWVIQASISSCLLKIVSRDALVSLPCIASPPLPLCLLEVIRGPICMSPASLLALFRLQAVGWTGLGGGEGGGWHKALVVGAPRTRKRHQQEHRPQRPTERSDPMQHAKGRPGDCPGPRKETTTRRNVTQAGGVPARSSPSPPPKMGPWLLEVKA